MLFSDRLSTQEMMKGADRQALLEALFYDFRKAFPDLTFELRLEFPIVNAQAIALADKRIVAIYGGLGLHPKLGSDALTFIILHEAGHHLADGCRSSFNPSLACECTSDHWAVTTGTTTLLRKSGRRLRLRVALGELDQVIGPRQPLKDRYTRFSGRISTYNCWAGGWPSRSRALFKRAQPPIVQGSCITHV